MRLRNKNILAVALLLLFWGALAVWIYVWFLPLQNNFDFYPRYAGVHAMFRGENPYELVFTDEYNEQNGYPNFFTHHFLYLATIAWILIPFWLLPIEIAVSVWCSLQLLLILTLPWLYFSILGWRTSRLTFVAVLLMSSLANFHAAHVFILGQFIAFILACLVIAWWQIVDGNSWLAALALVGATIRPEGCILVAVLLLDRMFHRQFKVVVIWFGAMTIVFSLTVMQIGYWIPDFLSDVEFYQGEGIPRYPPSWLEAEVLVWLFVPAVLAWAVLMLRQGRGLPERIRLAWLLSISILVVLLVLPQTHDYTLLYALFPIWFVIWLGRQHRFVLLLCFLLVFPSWLVRAMDSEANRLLQQFWVPLCLAMVLTFYWLRALPLATKLKMPKVE